MTSADKSDHIVKAYDDEFSRLRKMFSQMSGLAESQVDGALRAVSRRDEELAEAVRNKDKEIDDLETEIDALVVRMLALRQPVANDLRFIVAMLRMSADRLRPDRQGRITLTEAQCRLAGIGKDVVFVGSGDHAELWSPERLDGDDDEEDFRRLAGQLFG